MMILLNAKKEKENNNFRFTIGNAKIDTVTTYHYLGIDRDHGLLYDKMLDCMFNKANRKLYVEADTPLYHCHCGKSSI